MRKANLFFRMSAMTIACMLLFCLMLTACSDKPGQTIELDVPDSADKYVGKNYQQVQKEFENAGFTNIELVKIEDLVVEWIQKDGVVESVTINGDAEFIKGTQYAKDVEIIIAYHTSKGEDEATTQPSITPPAADVPAETEPSEETEKPKNPATPSSYMQKSFSGILKKTDGGYSEGNAVEKDDLHFGWTLGHFYIENFSRVIDEKSDIPVFLKTPGDEITLGFTLDQDIDKLNGEEKLSIVNDDKGYDPYFESTVKSPFGRGALFVKRIDYQGKVSKTPYTNYLPAKTVGADTKINTYEEGDYEVALDYKIKSNLILFLNTSHNYQLLFKFSVRNGSCMVYPRDIKTTSELSNGDVARDGFFIDLTKSRYLNIDVKREVLADGALDIRFNRPAKDGEHYVDEGIYTITAKNIYTNEQITKKICVGTNSATIKYFRQHP